MSAYRKLGVSFAVLGLFACDAATSPELDTPAPDFAKKGPVVQSVTGSVHTDIEGDAFRTHAINGIKHADGTVNGKIEVKNHDSGGRIHSTVECLKIVDGNIAIVTGRITHSNVGFIGVTFLAAVRDNGEGAGHPDETTRTFLFEGDPATACEDPRVADPTPFLVPVVGGNIQVRG